MTTTPKLGVGLLATNTAQKEVVVNEALVTFDALIARSAISRVNAPPPLPTQGATYIVGPAPTGVWVDHANAIAFWFNGWRYITPSQKLKFFLEGPSQWWTYSGSAWTQDAAGAVSSLDDLSNVGGAAPTNNDVLTFDGATSTWLPKPVTVSMNLSALGDVNLADLANGKILAWSQSTSKWVAITPPTGGGATSLAGLTDVDVSGAGNGKFLKWDGSKAVWDVTPTPSLPSLGDLTGVVTTGAEPNDVLAWNGAAWGPSPAVITYSFLGMVDGPMTFDNHGGKFLVVDPTESFMEFRSIGELFNVSDFKLQNLSDVPASDDAHIGKFLRLRKVGSNYSYTYETPTDTKVAAYNGSTALATSVTRFIFNGFDISAGSGVDADKVTITAKNALEFQADGEELDGDEPFAINFTGDGVGVTNVEGVVTVTIENGGGELATLSDVDLTDPPTDGQALVFSAISNKWVPGEAAGGGVVEIDGEAEPATYELGPFAPPARTMFPDRWNSPSADVTFVKNRGLVVQPGPQLSGNRHAGISRKLNNNLAPWVITTRVVPTGFQVPGHAGGIFLQRTANSAAVFLDIGSSSSDTQFNIRFGHVNAAGVETVTITEPNPYNWLRLSYDGNNIQAYVSGDGLVWQLFGQLSAATVLGGPPDRVGIENRSAAAHSGDCGVLVTYYDDPDYPAASRIQQGVVALGLAGLSDVDAETVAPTEGQALVWNTEEELWVPGNVSGVNQIRDLIDVDTSTAPPIVGQALIWDDVQNKWVPGDGSGGIGGIATEFDISLFVPGAPEADEIVAAYLASRDFRLSAGLEGSFAHADTAPLGSVSFTIRRNGVAIGTLAFGFGDNSGVLTLATDVDFLAGDRLTITSPVGLQGLTDLSITFAGSRL